MIDLTPLDVRKKRGDFRRMLRGYDPEEVDTFLNLVAERMETLVKENLSLTERTREMGERLTLLEDRERAVNDALVTAQKLRAEIREEAERQAEQMRKDAESEAQLLKRDAEAELERLQRSSDTEKERLQQLVTRQREELQSSLQELARRRARFIHTFRGLLEREIDMLTVEESRFDDKELGVPVEAEVEALPLSVAPAPSAARPADEEEAAPPEPAGAPERVAEGAGEAGFGTGVSLPEAAESVPVEALAPDFEIVDELEETPKATGGEGAPEFSGDAPTVAKVQAHTMPHSSSQAEPAKSASVPDTAPGGDIGAEDGGRGDSEQAEDDEDYAVWKANLLGHLGKRRQEDEP